MKKKLLTLTLALCVCAVPLWAVVSGRSLTNTLKDLCSELQAAYRQRSDAQQRFNDDYKRQHQRMIDVVTESNELSILLYTQEQEMTFDLAYALKKVTANYQDFSMHRRPYDHIVGSLDYEIDRNARLIEALRRLPPMIKWVRGRFSDPFVTLASNKRIKMNATTWIKIFQKSGSENRPLI